MCPKNKNCKCKAGKLKKYPIYPESPRICYIDLLEEMYEYSKKKFYEANDPETAEQEWKQYISFKKFLTDRDAVLDDPTLKEPPISCTTALSPFVAEKLKRELEEANKCESGYYSCVKEPTTGFLDIRCLPTEEIQKMCKGNSMSLEEKLCASSNLMLYLPVKAKKIIYRRNINFVCDCKKPCLCYENIVRSLITKSKPRKLILKAQKFPLYEYKSGNNQPSLCSSCDTADSNFNISIQKNFLDIRAAIPYRREDNESLKNDESLIFLQKYYVTPVRRLSRETHLITNLKKSTIS